ncbi:MAG: hypothetical protein QNJ70_32155 [Xenococcaceae cyanobacterium MO_207.B15]|nr:hypothetical protein [Xenococcaceae cyanobacterium MO_207.B15]MDJ0747610.1 hypothetical protein [Xenococcaceae cyanobacterium MO_167.B27]
MEVNSPNRKPLSPEEVAHLEKLKSVVKKALEDGKFSPEEVAHIKSIIWSDGKVTYEELRTVHQTIKSVTGHELPEMAWQSNR